MQLVVKDLHKSFGSHPVLAGVDLAVATGSLTAVLGPSGSGKTTLLRVIAGFERADRGTVTLDEVVVDDGDDRFVRSESRRIGYVPQEGALFPHLNAEKNVSFGIRRDGARGARVDELLEMVGLAGLGRRYPHQLSGGQQQRVALARALAIKPGLVLLDEPFSSLDATLRASVRADVQGVLHRAGTTAVLVTHDQDEALSIADYVAIIRDGRIGQFDTPQGIYSTPTDPDLARFLGEANLVRGRIEGTSVVTPLGVLALHPDNERLADGTEAVVLVRPEQIELIKEPAGAYLTGFVLDYQYFGHDAVIRVRPDARAEPDALVVRITGGSAWAPATRVGMSARGPVLAYRAPPTPRRSPPVDPEPTPGGGGRRAPKKRRV
jgi:iron(III) transport system ATP-binding protein